MGSTKEESPERITANREGTIKLRKQFSRLGFKPAKDDSPEFVDKWILLKQDYFSKENPQQHWMTKEQANLLDIPMKPREYVESKPDKELN